jgi:hypothetical protein
MPTVQPSLGANGGPGDSGTLEANTRKSDVVAAVIYFASALALVALFQFRYYSTPSLLGAGLLVAASIFVFAARRFADVTALAGTLLAWHLVRAIVFSKWSFMFSPWLVFNLPGDGSDLHRQFLFAGSEIVVASILAAATAWSLLRLTPKGWRCGSLPVRNRMWPGFVATLLFVVVWYVGAVTLYQIPIFDLHSIPPRLAVLHVEKHGLQFHETSLAVYRDGQFFLRHDDHRLFQYSFQSSMSVGVVPQKFFELIKSLTDSSPAFVGSNVPYYTPPRTWNAERWFVYLGVGRKPIRMEVSALPKSVSDLFSDVQATSPEWVRQETRRDICFGFCYDPTY